MTRSVSRAKPGASLKDDPSLNRVGGLREHISPLLCIIYEWDKQQTIVYVSSPGKVLILRQITDA